MKKISYKKVFTLVSWIAFLGGLVVSLGFVSRSGDRVIANDLDISITNDENSFVSESEIRMFFSRHGKPVLSSRYESISIADLESGLNAHPAIENAEVSADMNGELRVSVLQRTPVLRVINKDGESYYIDSQSRLMPLNENYAARVPVATGEIYEPYARRYQYSVEQISNNKIFSDASVLDDLYAVASYIRTDSVLSALIHQLDVNAAKEIELFPAVGNHRIVFGEAVHIAEKFNKLKLFYTEGMNKSDTWTKYSAINLKYKNLVVCTRK